VKNKLTFPEVFRKSFEEFKNLDALCFVGEKPMNYAEVEEKVDLIIASLESLGIQPGDKIAILSTNQPHWGISYLAITFMGAVAVPLLPDFHPTEISNILSHSEAKLMFISENLEHKLADIDLNKVEQVIRIDQFAFIEASEGKSFLVEGLAARKIYTPSEEDLAAIIYTSGTTGGSKGVMLTHANIISNAYAALGIFQVKKNHRFLSVLPLSHTLENTIGFIIPMIVGGNVHYLSKPPVPTVLVQALATVKPNVMLSVPMIIEKIYRNRIAPKFEKSIILRNLYKIQSVRKILNKAAGKKLMETFGNELEFFGVGGAKLDPKVEQFLLEAKFPYAIGYGLTETSPLVAGAVPGKTRLESTGIVVQDVQVKINDIDPKTGEGEIWVKGPNVMKGYYKLPEITAQVIDEQGWFKTGDLGRFDKDNILYIRGRKKNVIVMSSGENIYPEEIESIINGFKHVVESIVVEQKGKLVAMVHFNKEELEAKLKQFREDVNDKLDQHLQDLSRELQVYINSRVNRFSRIHMVVLQPIPFQKTATHKIKRYLYY
jgi:long-chain acyl-CoA synthetase